MPLASRRRTPVMAVSLILGVALAVMPVVPAAAAGGSPAREAPVAAAATAPIGPGVRRAQVVIGLIPELNIFKQKARFTLLGEYLARKIGVPVKFTILSRYGNIIESFENDQMDGAFFGSFTGALAIEKLGVVPLARPVNLDGSAQYKGYLFVRKDSGIQTFN